MRLSLILILTTVLFSGCVADRNVPKPFVIADALAVTEYQEKLKSMALYFGNQPHPPVARTLGERKTSTRANVVGRENKLACDRAFVSGSARLQRAARKMGGDAIINIKSNLKRREISSKTHFQCASGVLMSGIALKGTVVKLEK
jgi:uncharacterized protein YbjQ (UPF0145 family)